MSKRKGFFCLALLVAGAAGWYLFRPELLFVNSRVHEEFPTSDGSGVPRALARGEFHGVAHGGKGIATVHELAGGRRTLRFTDFETSNGPALRVYLIAAADAEDSETVRRTEAVDLGGLKGNVGAQNYELPDGIDLAKYRAVTIWCQRFGVNFATAPLSAQ